MYRLQSPEHFLGPAADDRHMIQAQQLDDLLKEVGPPQKRLEQRDLQIGAHQSQRNTGKPGPGPHVAHRDALRNHLGEHRTVQQVALPQSRDLARTDQTPLDPRIRKHLRVPDSLWEELTEYRLRLHGRLREFCCLRHGDRPSVPH